MGTAYSCCTTRKLRPKETGLGKGRANKTTGRLGEIGGTVTQVAARMIKRSRKNKRQTSITISYD